MTGGYRPWSKFNRYAWSVLNRYGHCESGRTAARASLAATGKTHKGKDSLGRPFKADAAAVREWRGAGEARKSIAETARHFELSEATVKRYCAGV